MRSSTSTAALCHGGRTVSRLSDRDRWQNLLDHDGYLPGVAVIPDGKQADVRMARRLRFAPGTILVMDSGYLDFACP